MSLMKVIYLKITYLIILHTEDGRILIETFMFIYVNLMNF